MEQQAVYTFRSNGKINRIRKAPTEPDDDAADRGWWISKQLSNGSHDTLVANYSRSLQYVQAKNLDMKWE